MRLQIRMVLNHLKKVLHLVPVRKHVMRKNRTPTQVNAKDLLRLPRALYGGNFIRRSRSRKRLENRVLLDTSHQLIQSYP